jgi:DNA recombination protein RmuC
VCARSNRKTVVAKNLRQSVDSYNKAMGSLEHQLLPGARRFTEMGIQPRKELGTPEPVELNTRAVPDAPSGEQDNEERADAGESAQQPNA